MSSIACGLGQLSYNFNRRTQVSVGGTVGTIHAVNAGGEYRLTNTTTCKYKVNRVVPYPNEYFYEHTLGIREQLTEDFALEMEFTRAQNDELKLLATKNVNILGGEEKSTSLEAEVKVSFTTF